MAPTCSRCDRPSVIEIRYMGQSLCSEHFRRFFRRRAQKELARQGRLPEGTIAVALSGGKDSVAVLHFLHSIIREHPRIDLVAVTVDEGIAGYRDGSIEICREVTAELGVSWHVVRTKDLAGYTIDDYASGAAGPAIPAEGEAREGEAGPMEAPSAIERPACGPCGVFRRVGINQVAREVGAAAVVTGHNLDDTAQTILMNHLTGDVDRLARLAPHTERREGLVPRLLPFRLIPEKEVLLYCLLEGLPVHDEMECPYAARAQRFRMRDVLLALEADEPGTRHRLVAGADRLRPVLVEANAGATMRACVTCGEPTSGDRCKACQLHA